MKKRLSLFCFALILSLSLLLSSCSKGGMDYAYEPADAGAEKSASNGSLTDPSAMGAEQKLVFRATVTLETTDYDGFIENLRANLATYGAYCSKENYDMGGTRYASLTVRVPSANYNAFLASLSADKSSRVISQNASVEEVTLTYATLKARSETLDSEIGTLTGLLASATTVGETQSLSESIYDLRCEKNEIDAKLAYYDDLVALSTVTLSIREVKIYTEPEKEGAFARIGENLKNGIYEIGNGFVEVFVFLVSAIPYLVVFGGIGTGIFFLVRKIRKKKKNNTDRTDQKEK